MIKQTSWEAYQEVLRGGVAKTQAAQVLQTMNFITTDLTRAELAQSCDLPINSICGRVSELIKAEVVYVSGVRPCSVTGRKAETLGVVHYE